MLIIVPAFFLWNITGDNLTYHQNEQCATVEGNPEAHDGEKDHHLKADTLKAKMCPADEKSESKQMASEVWANGHVHFSTKELEVTADRAYFHPTDNTVELEGDVVVKHKQNVAMGDTATIDLTKQTYTLHKAKGRVEDPNALKRDHKGDEDNKEAE